MKRYYIYYIVLLFVSVVSSCKMEDYEEVDSGYERLVYMVQNGTNNGVLSKAIDADKTFNTNVGVYCSGVASLDKDVTVTLAVDNEKFNAFNNLQEEAGATVYDEFPAGSLTVANSATIEKGNVSALVPVKIDPILLETGKTYLFVVTLKSVSDFKINPKVESLYYSVTLK